VGLRTLVSSSTTASGEGLATLVTLRARGRVTGGAVDFPLVAAGLLESVDLAGATTSRTRRRGTGTWLSTVISESEIKGRTGRLTFDDDLLANLLVPLAATAHLAG